MITAWNECSISWVGPREPAVVSWAVFGLIGSLTRHNRELLPTGQGRRIVARIVRHTRHRSSWLTLTMPAASRRCSSEPPSRKKRSSPKWYHRELRRVPSAAGKDPAMLRASCRAAQAVRPAAIRTTRLPERGLKKLEWKERPILGLVAGGRAANLVWQMPRKWDRRWKPSDR